jgi:hypothetical protein
MFPDSGTCDLARNSRRLPEHHNASYRLTITTLLPSLHCYSGCDAPADFSSLVRCARRRVIRYLLYYDTPGLGWLSEPCAQQEYCDEAPAQQEYMLYTLKLYIMQI